MPFLYENRRKAFSFREASPLTPHQGLCPGTPLGTLPPDPVIGVRFTRWPWSALPLWQILQDPPLILGVVF